MKSFRPSRSMPSFGLSDTLEEISPISMWVGCFLPPSESTAVCASQFRQTHRVKMAARSSGSVPSSSSDSSFRRKWIRALSSSLNSTTCVRGDNHGAAFPATSKCS